MKQHITEEQLQELSDKEIEILAIWAKDHVTDELPRLLTIGQMIEFLSEQNNYLMENTYIDDSFSYVIHPMTKSESIEIGWTNYVGKSKELCDALWEAVKEVLSQ